MLPDLGGLDQLEDLEENLSVADLKEETSEEAKEEILEEVKEVTSEEEVALEEVQPEAILNSLKNDYLIAIYVLISHLIKINY